MNLSLRALLLFGGTAPFLVSKISAAEHSALSPQEYIKENYLSPKKDTPLLQHTYGDPLTSQAVLLVFSSLTCPVCNEFHTAILPALKEEIKKNPALSLVIRDYPADPLSLKASSLIWANGPEKAKEIEHKVFGTHMKWVKDTEEKSLEELVKLVNECTLTVEEKESAKKAFSEISCLEKIFKHRNKDKEALGIEQVPAAWLVIKNTKEHQKCKLIKIKDIKDFQAIKLLIEESKH